MSTSHIRTFRAMLREEKGVILPGAPNALAARIIADLGFKAVYLTGAGLTNMHLVPFKSRTSMRPNGAVTLTARS
jgi:2-methylisocitrate lyase-like PEP mutase family enzyme